MSESYSQSNYVRAINAAATIVAASDTDDLSAKDVALNVLDLAAQLAKGQDKYFKKAGFTGNAPRTSGSESTRSSNGSSGSTGGTGLTVKQRETAKKAISSIEKSGGDAPYSIEELEELSGKERSDAIGTLFSTAWGER